MRPTTPSRRALAAAALVLLAACDRTVTGPVDPGSRTVAHADAVSTAVVLVGASDIATCTGTNDDATALLLDGIPGTVIALGDNAYPTGSATDYANCYTPTWGRHLARTRPAPGERDSVAGAAAYHAYFGAAAGEPGKGYYSYDAGEWHVVVLNTNLSHIAGSAQEQWLKADLAASGQRCTVAYFHTPRFFSTGTTGIEPSLQAVWTDLYNAGVELVVNGHRRFYERFAPQKPDGTLDTEYGVRQIIAGTGGAGGNSFGTVRPNSEVRSSGTFGVVKLTLDTDRFDWEFVPIAGGTFTDAGSGTCHDSPVTVANPGGPYVSEGTVTLDGTHSFDPQREYPLTYAWDFGDGTTGTGAMPVHSYAADGVYTATLTAIDAAGNVSAPATTTVTIGNVAPTVSTSGSLWTPAGQPLALQGYFSDPGADDAPWTWVIDWGDGATTTGSADAQSAPIAGTHAYAANGSYTASITVTDKDGGSGVATVAVTVGSTPPGAAVLLAAGDIAACFNDNDEATAKVLDRLAGTVFTLGDNAYPNGSVSDFSTCYTPTWGRHKARTYGTLGNHDYDLGNANAAFDYFGARVGPRGKGYYSVDMGDWHVVVLNDNLDFVPIAEGSEQDQWLAADLAASRKRCTLAIWHQPRFYSVSSGDMLLKRKPFWDRLYAAGAELILNGHQHQYERFAPQTPDGVRDDQYGIRQIIVGTGGEGTGNLIPQNAANSETITNQYGVIKLTLTPGHYEWEFVGVDGTTYTDRGEGDCHGKPSGEASATSLASSAEPSVFGTPVTLSASVSAEAVTVSEGTVSFVEGGSCASPGTSLGAPVPVVNGAASLTTAALTATGSPHTILACFDGGTHYAPSEASLQQHVNPAPVSITLSSLEHIYDGTAKSATATTDPAGVAVRLTYSLDGAAVEAPIAAGSYAVLAETNDGNYVGSATATLTITSGTNSITFDALPTRTMGDPDFTISATNSAGLPITFVSGTDACSVIAGTTTAGVTTATVHLTHVGLAERGCVITARQPGDAGHAPAADVVRSFDVLALIDGMAGETPNSLKWNGTDAKSFQVAILSVRDAAGTVLFDATSVDPLSVRLTGPAGTASAALNKKGKPKYSQEDVNLDGVLDLVVDFEARQVFLPTDLGDRVVTLTGNKSAPDGRPIRGVDTITIRR